MTGATVVPTATASTVYDANELATKSRAARIERAGQQGRSVYVFARESGADPFTYQGSASVAPGDVDYEGHARAFGLQGRECMVQAGDYAYTFHLPARES